MTRPFVPLDPSWWPAIAERLQAAGEPWPVEAVYMDLRWYADQERMGRARRPGRPTLAARWGWTDRRARAVLADVEQWGDPLRRPAGVQRASSPGPAEDQSASRETRPRRDPGSTPRPAPVQPASSECPHARVDTPTGHPHTAAQGETPQPPAPEVSSGPPDDSEDRARAAWDLAYARSAWGGAPYPWEFGHRGADHRRLRRWLEVAGPGDAGLGRLDAAIRAYLDAVSAGLAWPRGDPPTTRRFTGEIARWLQSGQATVVPHRSMARSHRAEPDRPLSIAERIAARRVPADAVAPEIFIHPIPRSEA